MRSEIAVATLGILMCSLITTASYLSVLSTGNFSTPSQHIEPRESVTLGKSLADGCHHVFLDIGANIGVHARFLFEPELYPNAHLAWKIFSEQFGSKRDNRDFCVFAFEPNPAHANRHKKLAEYYKKMGWRYNFISAGVSDKNGTLTFYHNHDEGFEEWGFSIKDLKQNGQPGVPDTVPTIRLAKWLENEVKDRVLPSDVYGNYTMGPRVVAKIDIEGSEYAVLPDLWVSGALCRTVDYMFGELHGWNEPVDVPGVGSMKDARQKMLSAMLFVNSVKDCRTTFAELDDEAYLHDGNLLPGETAE